MNTILLTTRRGLAALSLACLPILASAQMAQQPLLTKSSAVYPNLVFIFDDSGSMTANAIYQYGGVAGGYGWSGPGSTGTFNLTSNTYATRSPFVNLLYYNPRVRYKYRVDANGNNLPLTTLGSSTSWNVYFYTKDGVSAPTAYDGTGNDPTLGSSYFSTGSPLGYQPAPSELQSGASTITPYPNQAKSTIPYYPKFANRTDCVTDATRCTWAEELKNYAVWKQWHSTREAMAKTGIGLAFKNIEATLRLGWGRINTMVGDSNTGGLLDAGVASFDQTTKTRFYSWLYSIAINGYTPSRMALDTAGRYYSRTDSDGPWGTTPNYNSTDSATVSSPLSTEASSAHLSCRRSFSMLMTDGYYNEDYPAGRSVGNVDGTGGAKIFAPNGSFYQYTPAGTVSTKDTSSDSMADVAMKYWVTDLRPDLPNLVPASKDNESFWQNMSFYAIGLGLIGTLPQTAATISSLQTGAISWPPIVINDPKAIDDMWHATLDTRGQLLSAGDADSLTTSITSMMASINKLTTSQSGVAVSTASLKTGTRKYTPQFTTGSWSGNVIARNLDPITGSEVSTAWQVLGTDPSGITWNGIPAFGSRSIYVGTGNTSGTRAIPFTLTDMTTAGIINDFPSTARTASMVDYLRGDQSNEGPTGIYRTRERVLGDIVNSTPVFIAGMPSREQVDPSNAASQYVLEVQATTNPVAGTGTAYSNYKTALINRTEGTVIVGSNDGMVHAFRDGTSVDPTLGGKETFAFIPRTVVPNMYKLADKAYQHQFYVDGPNVEADLYSTTTSTWKQVVVGTTGAGGTGVYAMDVTAQQGLDATKVLWEVNSAAVGFGNLGYVLYDVQTGPIKYGTGDKWVGIFGNGYESTNGYASLFVVDLETGALIKELITNTVTNGSWTAQVGANPPVTYKNGLGGVKLVRDSSEQRVVGAYAGDLRGNMWRFDLSDSNPNNWAASILFSTPTATPSAAAPTGYPQPITAMPQTVVNPKGGSIVVFGTGKFYQDSDVPPPYSTQSLYGVWDKVAFGSLFPTPDYPVNIARLDSRYLNYISGTTFLQITSTLGGTTAPGIINWTTNMGWKMDLPFNGQRLVYPVEKLSNRYSRVLGFGTISPANVSTNVCVNAGSGTGWDFFLDGLYGADPGRPPDLASNYYANVYTAYAGTAFAIGSQGNADGRNTTIRIDSGSTPATTRFVTLSGTSSGGQNTQFSCVVLGNCKNTTPTAPNGIITREWRQLYLR